MLQSREKRGAFHNEIRRRQIDTLLAQKRSLLFEEALRMEIEQLENELDTPQKRHSWVNGIAVQLVEHPSTRWRELFKQLSMGVRAFGEDFSLWLQAGIVNALTLAFRQEWLHLNLSQISANIFIEIFYQLPYDSPLISSILEYEFILDVVELCSPFDVDAGCYYQLISGMICKKMALRDKFINSGLVQILSRRLKQYEDLNSDEVFSAISLSSRLVKIYYNPKTKTQHKVTGNVISILIPIYESYLINCERPETTLSILHSLRFITQTQRESLYRTIISCPHLLDYLMRAIAGRLTPEHRIAACRVVHGLTFSQNVDYPGELVHRGLFRIILEYMRNEDNHQMDNKTILEMIKIVSNMMSTSFDITRQVLHDGVFAELIYPCLFDHKDNTKEMLEEAHYALVTIVSDQKTDYTTMEALISRFDIFEAMCQVLQNQHGATVYKEALSGFYKIIKFYDKIYTGSENKVVDRLERFYNFSSLLLKLEAKTDNKMVAKKVELLFAAMNGAE